MAALPEVDAVELAQALIRCPSVTPAEAGALTVLQDRLEPLGFTCHRLRFAAPGTEPVENLYARRGTRAPNFCFAGHVDVVPPGDTEAWSTDPFGGTLRDGRIYGRGAADMKGAIACFVAAVSRWLRRRGGAQTGSVSLLLTGDEEGPAINGTKAVLDWIGARGEVIDACIVGEPTNPERLGEMVKIGRRGSLTGHLRVHGVQGHVAYPQLAENAAHRLVGMLSALLAEPLDQGSAHFQPSSLQVSTIDIANPAANLIPATARATFNIRFNDRHTGAELERRLRQTLDRVGGRYELVVEHGGDSFLTPPGPLSELVCRAVEQVVGRRPALSTTGGTSDARFIKDHCPVAEFGLVGATMHKVDESIAVVDLQALTAIYEAMLDEFFAADGPTPWSTSRS